MSEPKFTPCEICRALSRRCGAEVVCQPCALILMTQRADLCAALTALCARARSGGYWAAERAKGEAALRKARGEKP